MVLLQPCVMSLFGFAFALNVVGGQRQPAVHMKTDDDGERPCDIYGRAGTPCAAARASLRLE
jgi:hypothetical protein